MSPGPARRAVDVDRGEREGECLDCCGECGHRVRYGGGIPFLVTGSTARRGISRNRSRVPQVLRRPGAEGTAARLVLAVQGALDHPHAVAFGSVVGAYSTHPSARMAVIEVVRQVRVVDLATGVLDGAFLAADGPSVNVAVASCTSTIQHVHHLSSHSLAMMPSRRATRWSLPQSQGLPALSGSVHAEPGSRSSWLSP